MTRYVTHIEKRDREYGEYEDLCVNTMILKEVQIRKTMNSHKQIEGKLKKFKKFFYHKTQNTRFLRLG